jgi:hypothetical protein
MNIKKIANELRGFKTKGSLMGLGAGLGLGTVKGVYDAYKENQQNSDRDLKDKLKVYLKNVGINAGIGGAIGTGLGLTGDVLAKKYFNINPKIKNPPGEDHTEFFSLLDNLAEKYKKDEQAYQMHKSNIVGDDASDLKNKIEKMINEKYGKHGGRPWLSLPSELRGNSFFKIKAYLEKNNIPYDPSKPALHQLEKIFEAQAAEEAKKHFEILRNAAINEGTGGTIGA